MGLDPATVRSISGLLHRLAEKCSPRLILGLHSQDILPDWITNLLVLGNSGQVLLQGEKAEVDKALNVWRHLSEETTPSLSSDEKAIFKKAKKDMKAGILDRQLLWDLGLIPEKPGLGSRPPPRGGEPIIEMEGVKVQYGDKVVLGDWKQKVDGKKVEGLYWKVRRGQRWVVIGANGSGKTTLLSLITSDHPQAYALPIKLFGRSRLPEPGKPGISIFELQSRIGHSSPEIHAFFPRQLTVRQSVESAFAETFLSRPKLNHTRDLDVNAVLRFFKAELDPNAAVTLKAQTPNITLENPDMFPRVPVPGKRTPRYTPTDYGVEYADTLTFGSLSTAQQRLVLFIRALVHRPDIVILDEAFSGLSASQRDKCIHFLEAGETRRRGLTTASRRAGSNTNPEDRPSWLKGFVFDNNPESVRFSGLTDDQVLIMISHVKEEIPDSVRHYMRLPSTNLLDDHHHHHHNGEDSKVNEEEEEEEGMDFRIGTLRSGGAFNNAHIWDMAWSPKSKFLRHARRSFKKKHVVEGERSDEDVYEWYSL